MICLIKINHECGERAAQASPKPIRRQQSIKRSISYSHSIPNEAAQVSRKRRPKHQSDVSDHSRWQPELGAVQRLSVEQKRRLQSKPTQITPLRPIFEHSQITIAHRVPCFTL
jgi:hypothetical protein